MKFREEIAESLTLKFAESARKRKAEGKEIISLGLGEPDFPVPEALIRATTNVLQTQRSGYSSPMGLPGLKERIADQLKAENGIAATANNILITPGAKQSFQLALMALLEPGDEVIIVNPSFVSFIPQVYIAEPQAVVKIVDVEKSDFSLPIDRIAEAVTERTRLLIVNSPNNPAGYTFSSEEFRALYDLAVREDFYLLSDEIYDKLRFGHEPTLSPGSFETAVERVFTVNGYSKSHAMTGWRLGYLCFPQVFFQKLLKLQQHINTNTCTFIQQAVLDAFDMDMSFLKEYNQKLGIRAELVHNSIEESTKLKLNKPEAGFFAFIDISGTDMDSNLFCSRLIEETGVATTPGLAFGKNWDDHIRLSYAVDDTILKEGLSRLTLFVESL